MNKSEFILYLVRNFGANRIDFLIYSFYKNYKNFYIQVTDTHVTIMMNNLGDIEKSHSCILEIQEHTGDADFTHICTTLNNIIDE